MRLLIAAIMLPLLFALCYGLMPALYCRGKRKMVLLQKEFESIPNESGSRPGPRFPGSRLRIRLRRAGLDSPKGTKLFTIALLVPIPLLVLHALFRDKSVGLAVLQGIVILSLVNIWLDRRIRKQKKRFDIALYKIYRFIEMQLKAGMNLSDIIVCLPDAVNEKAIRPALQRMAAAYRLSGSLDRALQELEHSFSGQETVLLGNHLRQCMDTGVTGKSFVQMESLLFSRYLSIVREKSRHLRTDMLIAVVFASIPLLIVMLYPLFMEFTESYRALFSG